jgi:3-hydroxyacyl-CoA dehydrogenase/3-hydroxy-2-methylbutyryl-CoA dehydrogenase
MFEIQGPAIVTGGASGLGLAVVQALSDHGIHVTALDQQAGPSIDRVTHAPCDVCSESEVRQALDSARERNGTARLVVNCAGIGHNARVLGRQGVHALDLFQRVLNVNLVGTFNVLRLAAEQMQMLEPGEGGQRGVIINTSSIAAFDGQIGQAAYAASKAGVAGMTLPLARELGKYAIRVVTVCPGVFRTPMVDSHVTDEVLDGLLKNAAWPRRGGVPAEFAEFVLAIARNRMLNGETIRLDGGLRMPSI